MVKENTNQSGYMLGFASFLFVAAIIVSIFVMRWSDTRMYYEQLEKEGIVYETTLSYGTDSSIYVVLQNRDVFVCDLTNNPEVTAMSNLFDTTKAHLHGVFRYGATLSEAQFEFLKDTVTSMDSIDDLKQVQKMLVSIQTHN